MQAKDLYANYQKEITDIVNQIVEKKALAIPFILGDLATEVVPQMMKDVGAITKLSGSDKKQLILDAVDLAIVDIFSELNEKTELKNESWDEILRDILRKALPKIIDLLIKVEQDKLVFNKKLSCLSCF